MKNQFKWGVVAIGIYIILSALGAGISFLGNQITFDSDGYDITANILTSTQGLFTGILGYGDVFEYSGFYLIPFILGALVWFIVGSFLSYISRNKKTLKEKFSFIGKIFMILGIILAILSAIFTLIICLVSKDGFCILSFVFLAVIFVPLFVIGLIFWIVSKFRKIKRTTKNLGLKK